LFRRFLRTPVVETFEAKSRSAHGGYFFNFGKFMPSEEAHYVKAYSAPAQLHAAFEMYRAFPANAQFNAAQRRPIDVPLFLAAGDGSPFAKLVPKIAEGLRANGCSHVETGVIRGSVHYVVEDQPDAVADLIEQYASLHSK
jgi:pimeloyl-ACP methyl ester carboxylesterase